MSHLEQREYCKRVRDRFPGVFTAAMVLDIGALDVNGNNRYLFTDSNYVGVDVAPGPNVDVVSAGHKLMLPDDHFDIVISTECLEHDPHWRATLSNSLRMLKPGGLLVITCATTGRPEHGTRRTSPSDSPLTQELGDWADYYRNLTEEDIRSAVDVDHEFGEYEFEVHEGHHDLYFWGFKRKSALKDLVSDVHGGDEVDLSSVVERLRFGVETFVRGKPDAVNLALVCLLAKGHLLLDDVPGTGKTSLAKSLALSLGIHWRRIQFTPDLLPSDVTGVSVFRQDRSVFEFQAGPIFASLVLADEVNRASPRTQAALLEAMEERSVSIDGTTHDLPNPFMLIATQNPIDMAGTFPLPEAQLDRFLIRTSLGYPDRVTEAAVVADHHQGRTVSELAPVVSLGEILGLIEAAAAVDVDPAIVDYLVAITSWTRDADGVALGASPRGSIGLLRASRARALIRGRDHVIPEDLQALAEPVLAHRIILDLEAQSNGLTQADVIARAVASVPAPQPG